MQSKIRVGVYAVVVVALAALLVLNKIDHSQMTEILTQAGLLLGIAGGGLALGNITPKNVVRVPVALDAQAPPLNTTESPAPWLTPEER